MAHKFVELHWLVLLSIKKFNANKERSTSRYKRKKQFSDYHQISASSPSFLISGLDVTAAEAIVRVVRRDSDRGRDFSACDVASIVGEKAVIGVEQKKNCDDDTSNIYLEMFLCLFYARPLL